MLSDGLPDTQILRTISKKTVSNSSTVKHDKMLTDSVDESNLLELLPTLNAEKYSFLST